MGQGVRGLVKKFLASPRAFGVTDVVDRIDVHILHPLLIGARVSKLVRALDVAGRQPVSIDADRPTEIPAKVTATTDVLFSGSADTRSPTHDCTDRVRKPQGARA